MEAGERRGWSPSAAAGANLFWTMPPWRMLSTCLLLAAVCLQGSLPQAPGLGPPAKPFLERLRRLEEQFRRFREVTLTHLQGIAGNYNISYNIDARFQALARQGEAAVAAVHDSRAALGAELSRVATATTRLRRKVRRLEGKVAALGSQQELRDLLVNLTRRLAGPAVAAGSRRRRLRQELRRLQEATQLGTPEQEPQGRAPPQDLSEPPSRREWPAERRAAGRPPKATKLQVWHRQREKLRKEGDKLLAEAGNGAVLWEAADHPRDVALGSPAVGQPLPDLARIRQEQPPAPEQLGTSTSGGFLAHSTCRFSSSPVCNVGSMLLFPNTSTENVAVFHRGLRAGLRALSLCAWVNTPVPYLGTLLSYATEDNDNKLVVHGRDRGLPASMHFVIGDPEFRELPVARLLDGKWHHLCLIWSSDQGKYRFYVDRRLLAAGSGFQQGYEIPAGGSLVLGQEQDEVGRDFDPSEAFVGQLAGLALWSRALMPGEVASMATGQGLPPGPLLTLADASLQGWVRRVECACLERCL
ncbi:pentraxin-4 [Apteryx mantelli]|uniref:Pentraxin-4 n=1 Tax=Apteryx mantelli TaxID=2696672 RepID=A0ABM4FCF9_9AVES